MSEAENKKTKREVPEGLGGDHPAVVLRFRPAGKESQSPKKLEYFCLQGLGELPRLILEASETPYDSVMHFTAAAMKKYAPFGQLPIYEGEELPGIKLSESGAICRHIARTVGFAGSGPVEQARADQFFELAKDIAGKKAAIHDPQHGDAAKLKLFLEAAEKNAPANNTSFFVGDSTTIADVAMFHTLHQFLQVKPSCLTEYPRLAAFTQAFSERPAIEAYLKSERRVPLTNNEVGDKPWAPDGYKFQTPLSPSVCETLASLDGAEKVATKAGEVALASSVAAESASETLQSFLPYSWRSTSHVDNSVSGPLALACVMFVWIGFKRVYQRDSWAGRGALMH